MKLKDIKTDMDYEQMIEDHNSSIEHVICRRMSVKGCYNGQLLTESIYGRGENMEQARANYLSDGTLGDDGSIVCDACYCGF